MKKVIHPIAGALAMLMIVLFWTSTVAVELLGTPAAVMQVKTLIPWGLLILIPSLAAAGGTGFALGKGRLGSLLQAKRGRMPWIAANGVLILIPAALFLASKAAAGEFDAMFYLVQAAELIAGAINLALLGLNMRDGLRMKGRLRKRSG
jgi:hypothetical protein